MKERDANVGFLTGKKILLTGLISHRSIAYGIATAMKREGAELAFAYAGEAVRERTEKYAPEFGSNIILPCDVTKDEDIANLFAELGKRWGKFDGFVHAIAFAPREAIDGDFLEGISREGFRMAHDISSYSFAAMAKAALPMLNPNSALLTLSYFGAERAVPNYNTMGVAKASLEAVTRYMAASLGPKGIRANAISAGPIKTLAAAGIGGFGKMLAFFKEQAPLRRNVTQEEVGNVAAFMMSDLASAITGEITYVDCGFNVIASGMPT
jgi:enoyl-[acyl-carrier protein] reductase I